MLAFYSELRERHGKNDFHLRRCTRNLIGRVLINILVAESHILEKGLRENQATNTGVLDNSVHRRSFGDG
jgi:hypothetical protein